MACGAPIEVELYPPMQGRACRFCLCLQGGSVFADFDVDQDGRVFAVRVSFDGYGCCRTPVEIERMSEADSEELLAMVDDKAIDAGAAGRILRAYFDRIRTVVWAEALEEHGLVNQS